MSLVGQKLYTAAEAAALLGVAERTLETWRAQRRGPAVVRFGHRTVRYLAGDVEAWLQLCRGASNGNQTTAGAVALPIQFPGPGVLRMHGVRRLRRKCDGRGGGGNGAA